MMKYAIQDLMQTLKQEITIKKIKAKIQEKQDNGGNHLHLFLNAIVVYNRNLYFGLDPIPKPKPKLADTFCRYHN